jgi:hypothetical protein
MPSNNYTDNTFDQIDKLLRSASIANVGGPMLPNKKCMSWYGGKFVGLPEETWPETESGPMHPLLQVHTKELPFVPEAIKNIRLLTIFIDHHQLPEECPLENGSGWMIRTYDNLEKLTAMEQPEIPGSFQPTPIQWHLSSKDPPTFGDAERLIEDKSFFGVRHSILLFHERYRFHPGTKVGGWPGWVRGSLTDPGGYVLEIASEGDPAWIFGEEGKCYIFFRNGEWSLYWDYYKLQPRKGAGWSLKELTE